MKYANVAALAGAMLVAVAGAAYAGDPESCKAVRFSDVGWTALPAAFTTEATGRPVFLAYAVWS